MDPTLKQHLETLVGRGQRGMALGLDRVEDALSALGDPHLVAPAIVVAGTNGKGSVCAMLDAIAREAGLRSGLTTSPHLSRFAERIRIAGEPIADAAFAAALGRVLRDARDDLTFFETLTCAAFVAFAEAKVDLAILEVGLGGRLDATNVVPHPVATAVVSITEGDGRDRYLEHGAMLGSTVEAIAREKAGICKRGVPLVIGPLGARARGAVLEVARAVGVSDVLEVTRDAHRRVSAVEAGPGVIAPVHLSGARDAIVDLPGGARVVARPPLLGDHQRVNVAVAVATAWAAGAAIPRLREGDLLARGVARATWPGRLERLRVVEARRGGDCEVWLDAAHNLDGARVLRAAFSELAGQAQDERGRVGDGLAGGRARTILVFGALADKAYEPVLRELAGLADRRIYTCPRGRAPAPLEELAAIAPGEVVAEPVDAIERAFAVAEPGDVILVAGSIYLIGEIRAHLLGEERDPPIGL